MLKNSPFYAASRSTIWQRRSSSTARRAGRGAARRSSLPLRQRRARVVQVTRDSLGVAHADGLGGRRPRQRRCANSEHAAWVFEEYDLPGITTRDGIAEVSGNYPSKGGLASPSGLVESQYASSLPDRQLVSRVRFRPRREAANTSRSRPTPRVPPPAFPSVRRLANRRRVALLRPGRDEARELVRIWRVKAATCR